MQRFRYCGNVITAEIWDAAITVAFYKEVDELLIAITDESGNTVYTTTANTYAQQQVLTPLAALSSGTYTITLSNERGEKWGGGGEFEI